MIDGLTWFDAYDGPKRLTAGPEGATVMIGCNLFGEGGRISGTEITATAPTLWQALAEVQQEFESTQNVL